MRQFMKKDHKTRNQLKTSKTKMRHGILVKN